MTPEYRLPIPSSRGRAIAEPPAPIAYRLPVTVVHFRGTVTTVTSELDPGKERIERQATIDLDVVADPASRYEIRPPIGSGWQDRQLSLTLLPDGRLSGFGSEVTDRSNERLKAIVTLGATAAGALLSLGATPLAAGAAGVAAAALSGLVGAGQIEELPADGGGNFYIVQPQEGTVLNPEMFGVRPEFGADQPADNALLVAYRFALLRLTAELAKTAMESEKSAVLRAQLVRGLSEVLKRTRAEASAVEARYEAWLRSKETTEVATIDLWLPADRIPTTKAFRTAIRQGTGASRPDWWTIVRKLRTMVTIDYLEPLPQRGTRSAVPPGSIVYRSPRPAMLTTWEIVADGTTPSRLKAQAARRDRILVTTDGTERTIAILGDKKAGKVKAGLDHSGAITSLDVSTTSAAADKAQALSAVPGVIDQALTTGKSLGTTFDPKQLELQQLERDLKLAEAKAKLKGPADPDPALTELQDRVAVAQLQARLATADYLVKNPSQATILIQSTG